MMKSVTRKNYCSQWSGGISTFERQEIYRTIRPQMRVLCTLKSSIKDELNYKVIHMHYEEYTGKKCELKMKLFLYRFQIKIKGRA